MTEMLKSAEVQLPPSLQISCKVKPSEDGDNR